MTTLKDLTQTIAALRQARPDLADRLEDQLDAVLFHLGTDPLLFIQENAPAIYMLRKRATLIRVRSRVNGKPWSEVGEGDRDE